jgi:hypothetical protein
LTIQRSSGKVSVEELPIRTCDVTAAAEFGVAYEDRFGESELPVNSASSARLLPNGHKRNRDSSSALAGEQHIPKNNRPSSTHAMFRIAVNASRQ